MKIAINGFGRIGRNIVRSYLSKDQIWKKFNQIEIVAINDLGSPEHNAHLLKYDSVHGKLANQVSSTDKSISIDGNEIACFSERDPSNLPWKELDVDLVFECTGFFASKDGSQKHLDAGAKRVLISELMVLLNCPSIDAESFLPIQLFGFSNFLIITSSPNFSLRI